MGHAALAEDWLHAGLADRHASAYAWDIYSPPRSSYLYGRAGAWWVRALTGHRIAVRRYLDLAATTRAIEFIDGAAGHLTGARLLLSHRDDPRVRHFADALARRLSRRLRLRTRQRWTPRDAAGGFAHDWIGVIHALLEWHRAIAKPLPPWLADSLRRLARVWSPRTVRHAELRGAWCQGASGAALLWSSAHRATDDPRFLDIAREAATIAAEATHPSFDLCCGTAGASFACLELDGIDPGNGWRERARLLGAQSITARDLQWPNGLFRGHPGLACLALDLLADRPVGFPTICG